MTIREPNWTDQGRTKWPVVALRRLARLESGHTPSRQHDEYWRPAECTIPWFGLSDVWQLREGRQKYLGDTSEKISALGMANSAARLLPAGTVVLSRTASVGFSGIMPTPMATTQDFANWVPGPNLSPDFLYWSFQAMSSEFERIRMGSTHKTIYMPDIKRLRIVCPPLEVQRTIADFLDRKTAALDALIDKKERLLALLQGKRQALITQAVTKGLDPNVPMKDSGIEWLGEIPAHWSTVAIKRAARLGYKTFTDGDWIESPFITDDGVRLLQTGNVGIGEYREKGFRYVSDETFRDLRCTEVLPNDVLICRLDGPVGRGCLAPDLGTRMITSVDNAILKPSTDFDPRFIVYFVSSGPWLDWVQALCRVGGGFRLRISRSMLGDLKIAAPPLLEQRAIADMLDERLSASRTLEAKLTTSVAQLREYRQALITSAVTGQIDVTSGQA